MKATQHQYVYRHPKSPNLWYMRDIPADVRDALPVGTSGKHPTKWKESLGTAILRDAARKAHDKAAEHNALIIEVRSRKLGVNPRATLSTIDREKIELAGGERLFLEWLDERASRAVKLADEADSWRDFAADEKSPAEAPDPDWIAGKTASLDAERRQIERQLVRDVPVVKALGTTPKKLAERGLSYVAEAVTANRRDPATITLSGVVQAWKDQTAPGAPEQYEYPVKLFEELNGALPVKEITVDHVRAFRDALLKMPPASGGKFENMAMPEILRLAERKGLTPRMASTTRKDFRCLKAIFTFAADESYVDVNVAAGIKIRQPKGSFVEAKKAKRRTFSPAEMEKLFAAAAVAPWRDKEENLWFLRVLTYTGIRPEEFAQISARDVVKFGGHLCLRLHDEGNNHIKNESSIRKVPVHPELLRLGFEAFVKSADNRPYLFATLGTDGRGRLYGRMASRLTRLIDGQVSKDPRLVPYSLRHGFRNSMEITDAPEWVIEGIMGHSSPQHKTGRGYGEKQVRKMAEWIAKADPFDVRRDVSEFEEEEADDVDDAGEE